MPQFLAFLFLITVSFSVQAQPGWSLTDAIELNSDILLKDPNNHQARFLRAEALFNLGVGATMHQKLNVLDELDYIISQRPVMEDSFWVEVHILRARYKIYYEQSFERALDDLMLALRWDARRVQIALEEVIYETTYYQGRNATINNQIKAVLNEFVLYKAETFRSDIRNHYYFLFQEVAKLGKVLLENQQVERAQHIANFLCDLIPHDEMSNLPEVDRYLVAWELQCLIAVHNRNDAQFMKNFYLYIGSPYAQYPTINQDLINYYNFSVEYKDYYWYISKAIMDCQLAFSEMGMSDFRRRIFRSVKYNLEEAEKFSMQSDFYMTYFIRSIYEFEMAGSTQDAFQSIEKAIVLNPKDICAHLFKLHIMNMDANYGGNITCYDAYVLQALEDNKSYASLQMHNISEELTFHPFSSSLLCLLREYSSMIINE